MNCTTVFTWKAIKKESKHKTCPKIYLSYLIIKKGKHSAGKELQCLAVDINILITTRMVAEKSCTLFQ